MDKVSVIVPIYNAEKYLDKCLKSILGQTYSNIEVILVNDGSKDNSLSICRHYEKLDKRICVIDTVNEGVAIARNKGMEAASGSYLAFIDPDDWIEPEMYEKLVSQAKLYDAPICLCNFYRDTRRRSQPKCFEFEEEVLIGDEIIDKLVNGMIGMSDLLTKYDYIMGSIWRGIYEKQFIDAHEIRFVPKLTIMEDLVFMVQALLKCGRVAIDHGVRYHYVQHASSTLHTYNERMWEDQLVVYELLEESIREAHLEEQMRNRLDYRYLGMIFNAIRNETFVKPDGDFKETLTRMMDIFKDSTLKTVLERVKPIQVERTSKPEKVKEKKNKARKVKKTILKKEKREGSFASLYKERLDRYNE